MRWRCAWRSSRASVTDPFSPFASGALLASIGELEGKLSGSIELVDESGLSRGKRQLQAPDGGCAPDSPRPRA